MAGQSSCIGALGAWGSDPLALGTTDGGLHWYSATKSMPGGLVSVSLPVRDTAWAAGYHARLIRLTLLNMLSKFTQRIE